MKNQRRVVIDRVYPQINDGAFPIKRIVNENVHLEADVLVDGHDVIGASVLYKHERERRWKEIRMYHDANDCWKASFKVEKQGHYTYKVEGWVDEALNWRYGIIRKIEDGQHVKSELLEGAKLLQPLLKSANASETTFLKSCMQSFLDDASYSEAIRLAMDDKLYQILFKYPQKHLANTSKTYEVYVDRKKALFSTWYEFFPRSASKEAGKHGTLKDCSRLLPRIADMGFDTLYFPPIHPIGYINRKGKNNTTDTKDGDVGSAWGIGSHEGGHKSIHPSLGTINDFKALIKEAKDLGIEIAMDYALQAAPDHPWVKNHPDWFKWRPDGTVQYAENPPKKYQDILPIYWESKDFKSLWDECLDILLHWIDCGIRVFRVDNPHTKPYYFWNWIISEVKQKHPDIIFLAEAFTKPKVMQQLAKQGYTQSYTYFTWRNTKHELIDYVTELTQTDQSEYMRPNFWPNTPDINPFPLQGANESKYMQRYVLAATLSSNVGIYGPVYEQMIDDAIPGKEEYYMSEKFQLYHYNWEKENKLTKIISKINAIRHNNEALQQTNNIRFCYIENDNLLAYYKWNEDKTNELLIIVSLDPYYTQQGTVQLPLQDLGIHAGHTVNVLDLVTESSYQWHNEWNFVELHPGLPFHVFRISK